MQILSQHAEVSEQIYEIQAVCCWDVGERGQKLGTSFVEHGVMSILRVSDQNGVSLQ